MIIVAKDGKGDFKTIQEALDSISSNASAWVTVFIKEGVYQEKLVIRQPNIILEGESQEKTILQYADSAKKITESGECLGTFGTATLMVDTSDVKLKNLTIQNSAGPGNIAGQAIALYLDGEHIEIDHCRLLGNQDTVFTAPLPPAPLEPGGFKGPKEFAPRLLPLRLWDRSMDMYFIIAGLPAIVPLIPSTWEDPGEIMPGLY